LHFGPRQPGPRIAGYRIGEDQSAGFQSALPNFSTRASITLFG
jgi:hypothetical protein